MSEDEIQVLADKTRWLRVCDPNQASLYIAVGCALENLLIAAEHFGYEHRVAYFPEVGHEELVAIVKLIPGGQPAPFRDPALFHAITARHTSRNVYDGRPIAKQDSNRLQQCCVEPGIWLDMMDSRLVMSAPLVAVLSSTVNDRESQIKVGQVFERVCLAATMLGIRVQPLSATVDVPELKAQITKG